MKVVGKIWGSILLWKAKRRIYKRELEKQKIEALKRRRQAEIEALKEKAKRKAERRYARTRKEKIKQAIEGAKRGYVIYSIYAEKISRNLLDMYSPFFQYPVTYSVPTGNAKKRRSRKKKRRSRKKRR